MSMHVLGLRCLLFHPLIDLSGASQLLCCILIPANKESTWHTHTHRPLFQQRNHILLPTKSNMIELICAWMQCEFACLYAEGALTGML